jgi:hypothetical protein
MVTKFPEPGLVPLHAVARRTYPFNAHENGSACGRVDWLQRHHINDHHHSMAGHYRGVVNVGDVCSVERRHVRIA